MSERRDWYVLFSQYSYQHKINKNVFAYSIGHSPPRHLKIMRRLQVHPELRARPEPRLQQQSRGRTHRPLPVEDPRYPVRRYPDFACHHPRRQPQRRHELLAQHFAGRHRRQPLPCRNRRETRFVQTRTPYHSLHPTPPIARRLSDNRQSPPPALRPRTRRSTAATGR